MCHPPQASGEAEDNGPFGPQYLVEGAFRPQLPGGKTAKKESNLRLCTHLAAKLEDRTACVHRNVYSRSDAHTVGRVLIFQPCPHECWHSLQNL